MNCQIVQNSLSAYLDRELAGDQMIAMRSHVERCADCQKELSELRAVKARLSALAVLEPSEAFAQRVMHSVRAEARPPRLPVGLMLATSVAAAVFAVLVFNLFFGAQSRPGVADEGVRFDAASDSAVTSPDFGGHAPLIPVGR